MRITIPDCLDNITIKETKTLLLKARTCGVDLSELVKTIARECLNVSDTQFYLSQHVPRIHFKTSAARGLLIIARYNIVCPPARGTKTMCV